MAKNFIIIPNYPYYFSFNGLPIPYYFSAYQSFTWDESGHTLFRVIDRHAGNHVATYEADPYFSFHSINAWDEKVKLTGGITESTIYMDYSVYDNPDIVGNSFNLGNQKMMVPFYPL